MIYNNKKKAIVLIVIIIIIILCGLISSYFIFTKDDNKVSTEKVENTQSRYTKDYLLSNNYIKELDKALTNDLACNSENIGKAYIYFNNEDVYFKICTKNGLTSEKLNDDILAKDVYYNEKSDKEGTRIWEIVIFDDVNAYYSLITLDSNSYKFKYENQFNNYKIENIKAVYKLDYEKPYSYNNTTNQIIFEQNNNSNQLVYLLEGIPIPINDAIPYFDYVCVDNNPICIDTKIYITDDMMLSPYYNIYGTFKTNSGDNLVIKDVFTSFKIIGDSDVTGKWVNSDDLKFDYNIYALGKDNNLYTLKLNNKLLEEQSMKPFDLHKQGVSSIEYTKSSLREGFSNVTIKYDDGTQEIISRVLTSKLHDRENS